MSGQLLANLGVGMETTEKFLIIVSRSKSFLAWMNEQCLRQKIKIIGAHELDELLAMDTLSASPTALLIDAGLGFDDEQSFLNRLRQIREIFRAPIGLFCEHDQASLLEEAVKLGVHAVFDRAFLTKNLNAIIDLMFNQYGQEQEVISYYKKMIGVYKHDLGNILSIIFGKQMKLEMENPALADGTTYSSLKQATARLDEILKKLHALRKYPEEKELITDNLQVKKVS